MAQAKAFQGQISNKAAESTLGELGKLFKKWMLRNHPDKGGDEAAAADESSLYAYAIGKQETGEQEAAPALDEPGGLALAGLGDQGTPPTVGDRGRRRTERRRRAGQSELEALLLKKHSSGGCACCPVGSEEGLPSGVGTAVGNPPGCPPSCDITRAR